MGDVLRRVGAVVLALGFLAGALGLSTRDVDSHLSLAGQKAHGDAQQALEAVQKALRDGAMWQAHTAGSVGGIVNMVKGDDTSPATYADFFATEQALAPFRVPDTSLAILVGDQLYASIGTLDDGALGLAKVAAAAGQADGFFATPAPELAAATRLEAQTPNGLSVVIVYARRLDAALLQGVAQKTGDSVLFVTKSDRVSWPSNAQLPSEPAASLPCCAAAEVGQGVRLVVSHDPSIALAAGEREGKASRPFYFGGALALSIVALAFGFFPRSHRTEQLLRDTHIELQRSREELARLSQVVSASGNHPVAPTATATSDVGLGATQQSITGSRYQVIDLLGEGGMARVFVAVAKGAEGFKRVFVVKRLRAELAGSTDAVNQFIDEARLGASLVHSNIVPVFDFGRDSEGYYLAQEYILGRNIEALVSSSMAKRGRPLEPAIVLYLAQEALKALSYAHGKRDDSSRAMGLVHRDVSPNNLMVSALGEVKLLDFGIVKSAQRLTKTQTGMVKGNLFYMSPEQSKAQPVDARSDLFSLGLVIFYAATGETLLSGTTSYELLTRTAVCPSAEDLARIRNLPAPLGPLVERALSNDVAGRWASADDFAHAVASAGQAAPSAAVRNLMDALFHDDLSAEQARFSGRDA